MAISPVILNKLPFDAELKHELKFTYGGPQVFWYKLIVKDNATNGSNFSYETDMVASMDDVAIVPAGVLTNGITYNFELIVYDFDKNPSETSNPVVLMALKTPEFGFANVADSMIVKNSYLEVELSYAQENGELLDEYTVTLYGADETTIVYTSGIQYADTMIVNIPELMDNVTYHIRATGSTVNGMAVDTGLVMFTCKYVKPDIFLKFRADNIPDEGVVRLSSNFILIEGSSNPAELTFVDDEKVSLLNGEKVWYDEGFSADNFTGMIKASDIPDFATVITLNMKNAKAYITWNYGIFDDSGEKMYYAELIAYQYIGEKTLNYTQMSNRIPALTDGQQVFIWFKHIDGLFDLIIEAIPLETATDEGGES